MCFRWQTKGPQLTGIPQFHFSMTHPNSHKHPPPLRYSQHSDLVENNNNTKRLLDWM